MTVYPLLRLDYIFYGVPGKGKNQKSNKDKKFHINYLINPP